MHEYEFPRPSATATVALVVDGHAVVQVRRGRSDTTYSGYWSLPGGFLDAKTNISKGETLQETAVREIREELGIEIDPAGLQLINVYSDPSIDPRAHVISTLYAYDITETDYWKINPNTDEVAQVRLSPYIFDDKLAFNHLEMMKDVYYKHLRKQ